MGIFINILYYKGNEITAVEYDLLMKLKFNKREEKKLKK